MSDPKSASPQDNATTVHKLLLYPGIFVFGLLLWHIGVMPFLDLGADEAHYALYALNLSTGYFDHPPLIGWMLSPLVLSQADLISRLLSLVWMAIVYGLIYWHSYRLFGNHIIALIALLIFSINPMVQLLWFGMVPDVPLIISLFMLLLVLPPASDCETSLSWKQASLLGIGAGLAGLSKFTAIIIPISWVLAGKLGYWWRKPQFYWAIFVAAVTISPFVLFLWNTDFATFNYQFNHAVAGNIQWTSILTWLLMQILAYGPLLILPVVPALFIYWRQMGWVKFYIILLFLVSLYSSSKGNILPHWTISLYAAATPYIAHFAYNAFLYKSSRRIWLGLAGVCNLLLVMTLVLLISLISIKPEAAPSWLQKELDGWQEIADWSARLKEKYQADIILLNNWSHVSRIAWYAYPQEVLSLDQKNQQFNWWYGDLKSKNTALLLLLDDQPLPDAVRCSHIEDFEGTRKARSFFCKL